MNSIFDTCNHPLFSSEFHDSSNRGCLSLYLDKYRHMNQFVSNIAILLTGSKTQRFNLEPYF